MTSVPSIHSSGLATYSTQTFLVLRRRWGTFGLTAPKLSFPVPAGGTVNSLGMNCHRKGLCAESLVPSSGCYGDLAARLIIFALTFGIVLACGDLGFPPAASGDGGGPALTQDAELCVFGLFPHGVASDARVVASVGQIGLRDPQEGPIWGHLVRVSKSQGLAIFEPCDLGWGVAYTKRRQ